MLRAHLLGGLTLTWHDKPLPPIPRRTARSLLAYLLTYRDRPHTRGLLAGTFWPDLPEATARRRLSQALWLIRSTLDDVLPRDPLRTEGDTVQVNPDLPLWIDVEAFGELGNWEIGSLGEPTNLPISQSINLPQLSRAIELYQGDFLAGYYDDWLLVERERLRELFLATLEQLIAGLKLRGEYERALIHAQRLSREDPWREEAHREVMRLCHLLGRDNEALAQYETCRRVLAEELDAEPSAETQALAAEIARRADLPAAALLPLAAKPVAAPLLARPDRLPLVGRQREMAELLRRVEAAARGAGGLTLVYGEAGVGKTRLLQEVARNARWRGLGVVWGRCYELTTPLAYQPLVEALRAGLPALRASTLAPLWRTELARLLPELAGDDVPAPAIPPEEEKRRLLEALARGLLALAGKTPHLLLLEDAHWMGAASLDVLRYLLPRLADAPLHLFITIRSEELTGQQAAAITALEHTRLPCRLDLERLDLAGTEELVQRALALARPAPRFSARLHAETEGNPFFLIEMLQALMDEGLLRQDAQEVWSTPWDESTEGYAEMPLPASVAQTIERRLARLPAPLDEMVGLAAVLGRDVAFDLWRQAAGRTEEEMLAIGDELGRRGLLLPLRPEAAGADYTFAHDQIRRVAYNRLSPPRRRSYHRRAAKALSRLAPDRTAILAYHWQQAEVWDKAFHAHRQAGEQAQSMFATEQALAHYEQAIALADAISLPASQTFQLLAAREALLDIVGRREEQKADLERMRFLAQDDPQRLFQVYQRWAWFQARTSCFAEAEVSAQQALELARWLGDEAGQAASLTVQGTAVYQRGEMARAVPLLETAITLYHRLGDLRGEAEAQRALASAHHGQGAYPAAWRAAMRALELYRSLGDPAGQADVLILSGSLQMEQGAIKEAILSYHQALEICRTVGYRYAQAKCLTNLGNAYYFEGQVAQALTCYDKAVALFTSVQDRRGEAFVRANAATVRHAIVGDEEAARRDAQTALEIYVQSGDRAGEGQCLDTLGCIALRQGDLDRARQQLEAALAAMRDAGDRWGEISVHRSLAELALQEGRPRQALAYLDMAAVLCRELGIKDRLIILQADKGEVLLALGRLAEALEITAQAMRRIKPGVEQAYQVPFVHYRVLHTLKQDRQARQALRRAYRLLTEALHGLSPEQQRMSLAQVPEHRAIVEAYHRQSRQTVRLPRAEAPTGRPLRDDEYVEVIWTVDAPEDDDLPNTVERRRHRLLRLLRQAEEQGAAPTVDDLAGALDVSRATLTRDLAALRKEGHPVRTRGSRK